MRLENLKTNGMLRKIFNILPMPASFKNKIRSIYRAKQQLSRVDTDRYQQMVDQEVNRFSDDVNVHDLPPVFHYWSHKYLLPKFNALGIRGVYEFFADEISAIMADHMVSSGGKQCHVVSMGSGNCDIEIEIAKILREQGLENYVIECIDIVPDMLDRGRMLAESEGFASKFIFTCADCVTWQPEESSVDVVMAHQSLHHFVELEMLFDKIASAIGENGEFITSDIIGRNGHMRWPEALKYIDQIWSEMPERYKYNHMLKRTESSYDNWDCSTVGFEGIRAQDILPLLLQRFNFKLFLAYGNLTDIFIDRAFGHNFDVNKQEDLAFIDKISLMDDALIESGEVKPTHIMAIMSTKRNQVSCAYYKNLSPEYCVRPLE